MTNLNRMAPYIHKMPTGHSGHLTQVDCTCNLESGSRIQTGRRHATYSRFLGWTHEKRGKFQTVEPFLHKLREKPQRSHSRKVIKSGEFQFYFLVLELRSLSCCTREELSWCESDMDGNSSCDPCGTEFSR